MKGLKKMLLGIAFLMIALMGAIMYEGDFGYILFIVGAPLGLIFCIIGCYDEQTSKLLKKLTCEETEEKKQGGLSAKEYKKKMEQEKEELNKKLEDMVKEYNELADRYNKLIDDKAELERKNREKAYEVMYQQEHSR